MRRLCRLGLRPAPSVEAVFALAAERPGSVLLLDTHCKDAAPRGGARPTLLDWLPLAEVEALCVRCRATRVRLALAGSLGPSEIRQVAPAGPAWIAVRGAACDDGRHGTVCPARVRTLARIIGE